MKTKQKKKETTTKLRSGSDYYAIKNFFTVDSENNGIVLCCYPAGARLRMGHLFRQRLDKMLFRDILFNFSKYV